MKNLISHLLGDTRTAILAALLLRPEERVHVRELARPTGVSPGTLHREVTALAALGVLCREAVGRQVFFAANRDCPVFEELAGLLRKTAGLVDVVRGALQPHAARIDAAFIYGSLAVGTESSQSDVDVMILGDLPVWRGGQGVGAGPGSAATRGQSDRHEGRRFPPQADGEGWVRVDGVEGTQAVGNRQRK